MVVPQNGWFIMMENPIKWRIWGYHHLRKHPHKYVFINLLTQVFSMLPCCGLWFLGDRNLYGPGRAWSFIDTLFLLCTFATWYCLKGPKWLVGPNSTGVIQSGQIIATSHDLTPNGGLVREIPLFQGNLGWWNIIIWPDSITQSKSVVIWRDFPYNVDNNAVFGLVNIMTPVGNEGSFIPITMYSCIASFLSKRQPDDGDSVVFQENAHNTYRGHVFFTTPNNAFWRANHLKRPYICIVSFLHIYG